MLEPIVVVEPQLWALPGPAQQVRALRGDPSGPGVWFSFGTFEGHVLMNVTAVAPLESRNWPVDASSLLGDNRFFPTAMAVHDSSRVLFGVERTVVRFDATVGVVIGGFVVAHPGQAKDTSRLAPPEVVAGQAICALAIDHGGTRLAVASDYATDVQIVDLTDPDAEPVEVRLPERTAAHQLAWTTDGALVVTLLDVDGRRGSGNVVLVGLDGVVRLVDVPDCLVVAANERVVTGALGARQVHLIDSDGGVQTVSLQSVSGAAPHGYGLGGTRTMIATGLRDGTLGVFDWQGVQRATVPFPERPWFVRSGPAVRRTRLSAARYTQVDAVAADGAGQMWLTTSFPPELSVLPAPCWRPPFAVGDGC